jgi:hypothetical protein
MSETHFDADGGAFTMSERQPPVTTNPPTQFTTVVRPRIPVGMVVAVGAVLMIVGVAIGTVATIAIRSGSAPASPNGSAPASPNGSAPASPNGVEITGRVVTTQILTTGTVGDPVCGFHEVHISNGAGTVLRTVKSVHVSQQNRPGDGGVTTQVCVTTYTASVPAADVYSVAVPDAEGLGYAGGHGTRRSTADRDTFRLRTWSGYTR